MISEGHPIRKVGTLLRRWLQLSRGELGVVRGAVGSGQSGYTLKVDAADLPTHWRKGSQGELALWSEQGQMELLFV